MLSDSLNEILNKLQAHDVEKISVGLAQLERELPSIADTQLGEVINAVSAVFHLDTYEYPQFQTVVDRAVKMIASQGERVIPHLLKLLGGSDFKVEFNYAIIFGIIGAPAISPLLDAYERLEDNTQRSFIIYSFGKMKSVDVKRAIPMLLEALGSESKDIRDSAARTLGKIAENVSHSEIDQTTSSEIFDKLTVALKDDHSGVRSKACRSLGKMVKYSYLNDGQTQILKQAINMILGREDYNWDNAFVVRREATEVEEILNRL